ncbi:hypothetical protein GDO81_016344 [Engystomops pustulosus]|uniref:Uncharacterized protein n=1 Tax=Engystomops pustulosus TaxID=76066 RepID=A0AAV7AXP7_ENGPU|nr:hypothetical protein GDO81_016344 [Engystomops pustulosus]
MTHPQQRDNGARSYTSSLLPVYHIYSDQAYYYSYTVYERRPCSWMEINENYGNVQVSIHQRPDCSTDILAPGDSMWDHVIIPRVSSVCAVTYYKEGCIQGLNIPPKSTLTNVSYTWRGTCHL